MQHETPILLLWIGHEVIYAFRIERRSAPLYTVNLVSLVQKKFGKIGPVLPGRASDQSFLHCQIQFFQKSSPGSSTQACDVTRKLNLGAKYSVDHLDPALGASADEAAHKTRLHGESYFMGNPI
jgi:hypothetical protein